MSRSVLITPGWQVNIWNRVARLSESVAEALSALGRDVQVITPQLSSGEARQRWVEGIHIQEVEDSPKGTWKTNAAQALRGLRGISEVFVVDSPSWTPAKEVCKGTIPIYGIALFGQSAQGERIASARTDALVEEENELLSQADAVLVNNEILRLRLEGQFTRKIDKLEMSASIPPDVSMISSNDPKRKSGEIVVVGKIGPELGLEKVIRAMQDLPWATLKVIGMTRSRCAQDRIEYLAERLGVCDRVEFAGWARTRDVLAAIRSAEIAVAPSQVEYFGYSVMDAMLMKTPVIASAVNVHIELVQDSTNGMLFQNLDELKFALNTLHENAELRESYAAKAFEQINTERTVKRMAESLADKVPA